MLQYRLVEYVKDDGRKGRKVKYVWDKYFLLTYLSPSLLRPYIIDLESTNGTYINNQRLDPSRYVEIKEKVWDAQTSLYNTLLFFSRIWSSLVLALENMSYFMKTLKIVTMTKSRRTLINSDISNLIYHYFFFISP